MKQGSINGKSMASSINQRGHDSSSYYDRLNQRSHMQERSTMMGALQNDDLGDLSSTIQQVRKSILKTGEDNRDYSSTFVKAHEQKIKNRGTPCSKHSRDPPI